MAFGTTQYSFQSTASDIYEAINWCCLFEAAQTVGRFCCWFWLQTSSDCVSGSFRAKPWKIQ